jgi:hypothetical protein
MPVIRPSIRANNRLPLGMMALLALLFVLAACDPAGGDRLDNGPILIQDVTLAAAAPTPTRILSPTPTFIPIGVTSELVSPLQVPTIEVSFVLVTPTPPPSKTPTITPTLSRTPTPIPPTRPPTSVPPTAPLFVYPAPIVVTSPPGGVVNPLAPTIQTGVITGPCPVSWFFIIITPANCPLSPASSSSGAFQQFQNGVMIWVQAQDAIYVIYDAATIPRWQVFPDNFVDGTPDDTSWAGTPPQFTYYPRRGFALIWRNQLGVRDRLGWAVSENEIGYSPQVQVGSDSFIYISDPRGGVLSLTPNGQDWRRYN